MLRINIIASSLLLICSVASAERIVCFDAVSQRVNKRIDGDCLKLGICTDYNNQGMLANCIFATPEEWAKSSEQYVKFDGAVISGSRIVNLSQAEIDEIVAAEALAVQQAESSRVSALDTVVSESKVADYSMAKVDAAIDNIANLADAKAFLKRLVRAIVHLEKNQ